jgi:hypothetical protein
MQRFAAAAKVLPVNSPGTMRRGQPVGNRVPILTKDSCRVDIDNGTGYAVFAERPTASSVSRL